MPDAAEREALALGRLPHDGDHLVVLGDRLHEGHRAVGPEPPAERDLAVRSQPLVAEEHDAVVEDRAADLADRLVVEILGEVGPTDDRTARTGELLDGDAGVGAPRGRGRHRHERELRNSHATQGRRKGWSGHAVRKPDDPEGRRGRDVRPESMSPGHFLHGLLTLVCDTSGLETLPRPIRGDCDDRS